MVNRISTRMDQMPRRDLTAALTIDPRRNRQLPIQAMPVLRGRDISELEAISAAEYAAKFPSHGRRLASLSTGGIARDFASSGGTPSSAAPEVSPESGAAPAPSGRTPSGSSAAPAGPSGRKKEGEPQVPAWQQGLDKIAGAPKTGPRTGPIDRSKFKSELDDPAVRRLFGDMIQAEVGHQGREAQIRLAETVFNRAMYEGKTLKQILSDEKYYQPYRNGRFAAAQKEINEEKRNHLNGIIDHTYAGSDETDGAAHNFAGHIPDDLIVGKYGGIPGSIKKVGNEKYYRKKYKNEIEGYKNLPRVEEKSTEQRELPSIPEGYEKLPKAVRDKIEKYDPEQRSRLFDHFNKNPEAIDQLTKQYESKQGIVSPEKNAAEVVDKALTTETGLATPSKNFRFQDGWITSQSDRNWNQCVALSRAFNPDVGRASQWKVDPKAQIVPGSMVASTKYGTGSTPGGTPGAGYHTGIALTAPDKNGNFLILDQGSGMRAVVRQSNINGRVFGGQAGVVQGTQPSMAALETALKMTKNENHIERIKQSIDQLKKQTDVNKEPMTEDQRRAAGATKEEKEEVNKQSSIEKPLVTTVSPPEQPTDQRQAQSRGSAELALPPVSQTLPVPKSESTSPVLPPVVTTVSPSSSAFTAPTTPAEPQAQPAVPQEPKAPTAPTTPATPAEPQAQPAVLQEPPKLIEPVTEVRGMPAPAATAEPAPQPAPPSPQPEAAPSSEKQDYQEYQYGGEKRVPDKDNLRVINEDTGKTLFKMNPSEGIHINQVGNVEVTPQQRIYPGDIQKQQKVRQNKEMQESQETQRELSTPSAQPSPQAYTNASNPGLEHMRAAEMDMSNILGSVSFRRSVGRSRFVSVGNSILGGHFDYGAANMSRRSTS